MNSTDKNKGPRILLINVFSVGLVGILVVFVLLSYFTFTRLLSFESTLTSVSDKALPKLISTSQLYSQASRLLESAPLLSNSSSNASKRLAEKQLEANLNAIRRAAKDLFANEFLEIQLNTIALELDELSTLIASQFVLKEDLKALTEQLYQLNNQAQELNQVNDSTWVLKFSQIILNVNKALNETRLQAVRFLFVQLEQRLEQLELSHSIEQDQLKKQQLTRQLKTLLFTENGLEVLKIQSLRLKGRAIGRENFVHNLVEDYVTQIGFVTNETQQGITLQVADSVVDMNQQTDLIRFILIAGVMCLLVIVIMFQQRVLKRLRIFNLMVLSETQGIKYQAKLGGNDEITDLAEAFNEFTNTIEKQKQSLEQLSMSDDLTGIANRRGLNLRLEHDITLSIRQKSSLALLIMDIDCFKLYNDNYGHVAGDECLKAVSQIIQECLHRDSDFIARYGGEEFICVLPNTNQQGAKRIATQITQSFNTIRLPHKYSNVTGHITISTGIVMLHPDAPLPSSLLIKRADQALYAAKAAGKNTFEFYSDSDV
jgi:diguanylate cyclase (GGDEF)-like protein